MFTRNVTLKLKANSAPEFTRLYESNIVPILRKQKGFRDEITLIAPERLEVMAFTLWDTKEDAEAYNRTGYPEVLNTISKVVEGTPKVETFELCHTTFQKVAAKQA